MLWCLTEFKYCHSLSAKEQRQTHHTFSIVLTAAPAQVPQTTASSGDRGLTCRPTCRKKRNRAQVSQDLCVSQNTAKSLLGSRAATHTSIRGLCLQKPQSLHPKALPHSHLFITVQAHRATRPVALFKGEEWLSRYSDKQRKEVGNSHS